MNSKSIYLASLCIAIFCISCSNDNNPLDPIPDPPTSEVPDDFTFSIACDPIGNGKMYEVGPGKEFERIVDVPFESLKPGDVVAIHAKDQPYKERILLTESGTEEAPIMICGVPDTNGNLPILDGGEARVRTVSMNTDVASLGVIVIARGNGHPYGSWPKNIEIKNLKVIGGNQFNQNDSQRFYAMDSEELVPYSRGAAGIRIQVGENIKIANNIIEYNGNGVFAVANGTEEMTRNVELLGNIIRNNGTFDVDRQHNIYIEVDGLISVGNQFGPIREGSRGNNYKSRSAGDVIMYNRFVDPAGRQIDLVESQNGYPHVSSLSSFRTTYFIGNIIEGTTDGAGNFLHYGGDGDNGNPSDDKRQGTVYCYNNTFVLKGNKESRWRKMFCDLNTCNEKLYAFNNIFYYENPGVGEDLEISILRYNGTVEYFSNNLITEAAVAWYKTGSEQNPCENIDFAMVEEMQISDENFALSDQYKPLSGSNAINNGMAIPDFLPVVDKQFKAPNWIEDRPNDGSIDVGAFEHQ